MNEQMIIHISVEVEMITVTQGQDFLCMRV
jgi:hypothetical protein